MQSANSKIHQNLFNGGLNKDLNGNFISGSEYTDAQNLTLVEDNKFLSLQNIKGTTSISPVKITVDNDTLVLGSIAASYTIGDVEGVKCLTVFTAKPGGFFRIYVQDLDNEVLYLVFEEAVPADYFTSDRLVDAELYPENNTDVIYFTDYYKGIRKLRCEIPLPYTGAFITEAELSLSRAGAIGYIDLASVQNGGSLFCGSYQMSYQLFIPGTNKTTKFSLLSNPIQIFDDSAGLPTSLVGASTNKKIFLNIYPSEGELEAYTHFRLAVLENIYAEGVNNETALLTDTFAVADYLSNGYLSNVPYATNLGSGSVSVPLSEIVVDLAAVETVKTIAIRDNRLIAGNIKYKDLAYDNSTPAITGGSVLKQQNDFYSTVPGDYERASRYVGYYRGEVYRYAISYFDEFGNFSAPSPIDMSRVDGNKFTGSLVNSTNNISLTNSDFNSGLTGWSQVDPGTGGNAYTAATLFTTTKVARAQINGVYSDIIYQPITFTLAGSYTLQINAWYERNFGFGVTSYESQIVYLDAGNNILGSSTLDISNGISSPVTDPGYAALYQKQITIPLGTVSVGFRARLLTTGGTNFFNIDNVKITSTHKDMKYPGRDEIVGSARFSLLNAANQPENLGLRITGIVNHPTWSRGFVILRAKRKKDILWQSPMLPMMEYYGIGAVGFYPTKYSNGTSDITITGTTPMGPSVTYFPNNYFFRKSRRYFRYDGSDINAGLNTIVTGETNTTFYRKMSYGMVFPPQTMYSKNSQYVFGETHKLKSVDAAFTNLFAQNYDDANPTQTNSGNYLNTSVSGTVYSLSNTAYYYDANHNRVTPTRSSEFGIGSYRAFDNLSDGFSMNGVDFLKKENLTTGGFTYGGVDGVNVQKGAVLQLQDPTASSINIIDSSASGTSTITFSAGVAAPFNNSGTNNKFIQNGSVANNFVGENTVEIVNCRAGLTDDRYGSPNAFNEYILTGTHVVFTESELSTVAAGALLLKTVDVWGGDCVVSKHIFKFSDTVYNLINGNKWYGNGETYATVGKNWTAAFLTLPPSNVPLTILAALKNASQYVEVFLESEYNGMLNNSSIIKQDSTTEARIQDGESVGRTPMTYEYNMNHNVQNDKKIFVPQDTSFPNVIRTKARLIYSDQKVYQGGIEGFDVFRALNFYDLGENFGGITKLSLVSDNLFALQEKAINYVGVGERVLEQTDADQLSVRTGDVIGTVILIDTKRGCQHMKSVQNTGATLYFLDNFNKTSCSLVGDRSMNITSDIGLQSEFRQLFENVIPENEISSVFDPIRREYWIAKKDGDFCYIFNEGIGKWISNYEFANPNGVLDGAFTNQNLYLIGRDSDGLGVHSMYTNNQSILFGNYVEPRVSFIINPEYQFGKQFDNLLVVSSDKLLNTDLIVERESSLGNQVVTGLPVNVTSRGLGNYRVKILRDASDARLKGGKMEALIRWDSSEDSILTTLTTVLTQYRPIQKQF